MLTVTCGFYATKYATTETTYISCGGCVYSFSVYIHEKSVTEACFYFCKSILFLQVLFIFAPFLLVMWLVSQISEPAHPAPTNVSLQVTRP